MRKRLMRLLALGVVVYCSLVVLLVFAESSLVYQPHDASSNPADVGLVDFERKTLQLSGLPTIAYWENPSPASATTIIYFHGNGGGLYFHAKAIDYLARQGFHVVAIEYPGYPGSEGKPEEKLIIAQALALYDFVQSKARKKPVIWGYSLGSGVATQVAAKRSEKALILEAPFTATVDRAAELFTLIPVRLFMHNQYRSRDVIAQVKVPVFIMHGDADQIIPIHHGRALFKLANEPKRFKEYPGFGHMDLLEAGAYDDAVAFIREQRR